MKLLEKKYNVIAIGANILFPLCWIMVFKYSTYNYAAGGGGPKEIKISILLDLLQMIILFVSFVFALVAIYKNDEKMWTWYVNVSITLIYFILTGMYDCIMIYILIMEPIHLQMLFQFILW
ncbi:MULTISPECIES: hypothetical protein [Bacillus cereus group]|uniref:Uncharacterized protein n=1 Tax=Bacillus cereus TaxID=1396 RepID=A0AA44TEJ6_BACCE|nr:MULTISPECIES: hypothetical protein [Bacillus cereus group]EEL50338.1 hypothetical protein bcere0022_23880 [Bacillus cereus Rock3-44]PFA17751.1 hypothetical protein CN373_20050 [Bacillus cereus]PFN07255.1 hypothetical protein COJ55_11260 [Bacillus cereus]PFO83358.1 hypothetical protein COJ77_09010 [Bacillus cereus]PFR27464.1 hypothetical protein COK19_10465 [Bacillus cereus]